MHPYSYPTARLKHPYKIANRKPEFIITNVHYVIYKCLLPLYIVLLYWICSALSKSRFGDYWFASGTPTFLIEILKKKDFDFRQLDGIEVSSASLSDNRANISNPVPMIYQSGYLAIKSYDQRFHTYMLRFDNEEVKYGFLNFAAPFYSPAPSNDTTFYMSWIRKRNLTLSTTDSWLKNHNYNSPSFTTNTPNDNKLSSNIHIIIHLLQLIIIFTSQE